MFKWVTPALPPPLLSPSSSTTSSSPPMKLRSFLVTTNKNITKATATTTTTKCVVNKTQCRLHRLSSTIVNFTLTTLIIISVLLASTTSGFRPVEAATANASAGRKLFGGYRITPKHCRATKTLPPSDPRANGPTICMFNHECAQRDGEVVGACMDGFLFGACCQIPNTQELANTLINDAQNSYFQQQQKLQLQQSVTNSAAAQSYEIYGEQQQVENQSNEQKYTVPQKQQHQKPQQPQQPQYGQQQEVSQTTHHDIYTQENIDKVFQQLESSSIGYGAPPVAITQSNNPYGGVEQTTTSSTKDGYSQSNSQQIGQYVSGSSVAPTQATHASFEDDDSLQADNEASDTNSVNSPPSFQVHKHSVKISSPSSPPQNDDFVMQVLSTLPPESQSEHITFTTEVPNRISSSISEQTSSESNSFEETQTSEAPNKFISKPTKQSQKQTETTKPHKTQKPQHHQQHQQHQQYQQQQQQIKSQTPATIHEASTNAHHHNHLMLDGAQFTHSDITHPGADADLVEDDLQFSTGYGPQPVFVEPPKAQESVTNNVYGNTHQTPPSASGPADDKYVLVQTISNAKYPSSSGSSTTSSSITTHVDSIESILLQLNNTNHGPSYNVVNQQTPSYGFESTHLVPQNSYMEVTTTTRPKPPAPTSLPATYYQEIETKRPEDYSLEEQTQEQEYGVTGSIQANTDSYDKVSSEQSNDYQAVKPTIEQPTRRPSYGEDSSSVLDEHTAPANSYNDVSAVSAPQTSEFNKMPAVGIAYPVDMAYIEGESTDTEEQPAGYGQMTPETITQANFDSNYQKISSQPAPTYTRPSTTPSSHNRPVASYIGMITMQNYNQQSQTPTYHQVPDEVSVSSHTTKVQEDYAGASSNYLSASTDKYVSSPALSSYDKPSSTAEYISSTSTPLALRPQYDAEISSSSTLRPVLVTASPKPRPKPSTKRPNKHPSSTTTANKTVRPTNKNKVNEPLYNYNQTPQPLASYNKIDVSTHKPASQPTNVYNDNFYTKETKKPNTQAAPSYNKDNDIAQSTSSYTQQTNFIKNPVGPPQNFYSDSFNQAVQPSLTYNQDQQVVSSPTKLSVTRKPGNKKPGSTSYVTGPSTPRPPATVDYHYDNVPPLIVADDKLDAFIQSTAENYLGSTPGNYQAPVYATSATPIHVHRPQESSSTGNNKYKKPGFVKINPTLKPPSPTVLITPKPTVINLVTSSSGAYQSVTPTSNYGDGSSYIYQPTVTRRPGSTVSTQDYPSIAPVISNDFEDPGYFSAQTNVHPAFAQSTTEAVYPIPSDDKPAFPGYYGPTPTYPAFAVPGEKVGSNVEEETYTSPNDFVNFPPVRNPNLNMSAVSSAVTNDFELSTPAFVEDVVLKDKMNTLVHKLVASLQGNFDALADMIDETNVTAPASSFQSGAAGSTTVTRKPTRKPTRIGSTNKPKATTKKPVTRVSTKAPPKRTSITTRKPSTRRPTATVTKTTRKPASSKPTRRVVTTTTVSSARPAADEIVDEEDEEDVNPNPIENEIDQDTLSSYGSGGRKIQCGVRPHVKSGRIVGGKGSTFGAFPWQVLVRESTWLGLFTKNKCGGVLITNRYVITAAHCQPGFLASLVAVMGEFDISGDLESKRPVTKNVKRVIVHRQYDPATFENDLALLELESPVQFDTHIVPICMPNDSADFTGRMATVTGWGRLKYGGGVPSVLQEVQVPVIENSVCQEMFHTAGHNKKILNSFLCAGYANGQKDSCEGDSGGPLVLQRPDGRYELAGTVSHGIKCAAPYLPGVYMRTTFYKPWLRSITGVK